MINLSDWLTEEMSCKRFARHVAMGVTPLEGGLYTRFHFWLHWVVCPFCRHYWKEIRVMGKVQRTTSAISRYPAVKISEVKARLKEKLGNRRA